MPTMPTMPTMLTTPKMPTTPTMATMPNIHSNSNYFRSDALFSANRCRIIGFGWTYWPALG
jgi:hypothetical protein